MDFENLKNKYVIALYLMWIVPLMISMLFDKFINFGTPLFYLLLIWLISGLLLFVFCTVFGIDRFPGLKKNKKAYEDTALWFLRWAEPRGGESKYLKDISEYKRDKRCWFSYQNQRRYYINKLLKIEVETGVSYITELKHYYESKVKNDAHICIGVYSNIVNEMENENITLMYIPGRDYIAINGPVWADSPSSIKKYDISDRVYIISHENIDRLVMDHMPYYDIEKINKD